MKGKANPFANLLSQPFSSSTAAPTASGGGGPETVASADEVLSDGSSGRDGGSEVINLLNFTTISK